METTKHNTRNSYIIIRAGWRVRDKDKLVHCIEVVLVSSFKVPREDKMITNMVSKTHKPRLECSFLIFRQAYIQDRLVFKTGLCAVLHPSDRHKITYCTQICTQRPIHHTHFLCRVYSCGLYSRAAYMQHSPPKREAFIQDRLIFKGGFYTRLEDTCFGKFKDRNEHQYVK